MSYYHASPTGGITQLKPNISNHGIPLIYFSLKRENVLVYLSNAVEKYCKEIGFKYGGVWEKWGPYGFDANGIMRIEEYYPNALTETYKGVSGFIYSVDSVTDSGFETHIPNAATSNIPVDVSGVEFIPDAYEAIIQAEKAGLLSITRYEDLTDKKKEWIKRTVSEEYDRAEDHPEYRYFLKGKFTSVL